MVFSYCSASLKITTEFNSCVIVSAIVKQIFSLNFHVILLRNFLKI